MGLGLALAAFVAVPCLAAPPRFETDVAPILRHHCVKCHGPEARKGGLDLRTVDALMHGGDTGPAAVSAKSSESLIVEQVTSKAMPPGKNPKLTDAEVAVIRAWIDAGTPGETKGADGVSAGTANFWSFRPPARPPKPVVRDAAKVRNPVDAFLLAALEAKGLTFSPEASRRTLVRRLFSTSVGYRPRPNRPMRSSLTFAPMRGSV